MEQVRPIFIYLTGTALVLAIIGVFMLSGDFSGSVVSENQDLLSYDSEKVSLHNTINDCWISYNNYVYDITLAVNNYPEFEILKSSCGQNVEDSKISSDLSLVLDNYKIGKLG